jgi:molybdopterin converting factor small subunit
MAKVEINFLGPLGIFLGVQKVSLEVDSLSAVRQYIEKSYGPAFQKKLQSLGLEKEQSLWDNSLLLLNGRSLRKEEEALLKDGDRLDLGLAVAGG